MQYDREDPGATRIVTLDIETTHYKPSQGEVVSIGLAEHERGTPAAEITYHLIHRDGAGEAATIQRGLDTLAETDQSCSSPITGHPSTSTSSASASIDWANLSIASNCLRRNTSICSRTANRRPHASARSGRNSRSVSNRTG